MTRKKLFVMTFPLRICWWVLRVYTDPRLLSHNAKDLIGTCRFALDQMRHGVFGDIEDFE